MLPTIPIGGLVKDKRRKSGDQRTANKPSTCHHRQHVEYCPPPWQWRLGWSACIGSIGCKTRTLSTHWSPEEDCPTFWFATNIAWFEPDLNLHLDQQQASTWWGAMVTATAPKERLGGLSQFRDQAGEHTFYVLRSMFHAWNISNSSSLSMYHRFRMMAGTTEDPAFAAAVDVAVDVAQNITLDEMSWNIDTGSWMGSQDVAGVNSTLTSMNTKLDMILARHETSNSNRRFAKRVSCCPPLCSFLLSLLMMLFCFSPA